MLDRIFPRRMLGEGERMVQFRNAGFEVRLGGHFAASGPTRGIQADSRGPEQGLEWQPIVVQHGL
jgi:hypothetical protein